MKLLSSIPTSFVTSTFFIFIYFISSIIFYPHPSYPRTITTLFSKYIFLFNRTLGFHNITHVPSDLLRSWVFESH